MYNCKEKGKIQLYMCLCILLQVGWYQTNNSLSSKDKPPKSKSIIEQKRQKLKTTHCKTYTKGKKGRKMRKCDPQKHRNSRYTLCKLYKI